MSSLLKVDVQLKVDDAWECSMSQIEPQRKPHMNPLCEGWMAELKMIHLQLLSDKNSIFAQHSKSLSKIWNTDCENPTRVPFWGQRMSYPTFMLPNSKCPNSLSSPSVYVHMGCLSCRLLMWPKPAQKLLDHWGNFRGSPRTRIQRSPLHSLWERCSSKNLWC